MNDAGLFTLIGVLISSGLTYLGVRFQYARKQRGPAEVLFDAYEQALKDYQARDESRQKQLNVAWETINNLQTDLDKARNVIYQQQQEIDKSKKSTDKLMSELQMFKDTFARMYKLNYDKAVAEGQAGQ